MTINKRELAALTLGALVLPFANAAAELGSSRKLKDVGRKFGVDGRVQPFAGNTIVAHLPQQGADYAMFDRVLDIYRDLPTQRFARKVTALPSSSYHMTIFGGANDRDRVTGPWPEDLPRDWTMARCNDELQRRFAQVGLDCELPFRMMIDDRTPPSLVSAISLQLRPVDVQEAAKLRQYRDRISRAFKIRQADHDSYQYHITIGYQIQAFTEGEEQEFQRAMARWRAEIAKSVPVLTFGAPEFCVFADMFAFRRVMFAPAG